MLIALVATAILGLNFSALANPDGVTILGPGEAIGGVYITPGSRARDLVSGNHKALAINQEQSLLTSNGDIETAWSKHSTSAVNATPSALTVAAATGVTHCLTSLQFTNFHDATGTVTVATGFPIYVTDGAFGPSTSNRLWTATLSWPVVAAGNSNHIEIVFPTPLKSTAGNALVFTCGDTAALLHTGEAISMQGYSIK